jgi:homoserine kinase
MKKLPKKVDLRTADQEIYDQGGLGSSTACAVAAAYKVTKKKVAKFRYYKERDL